MGLFFNLFILWVSLIEKGRYSYAMSLQFHFMDVLKKKIPLADKTSACYHERLIFFVVLNLVNSLFYQHYRASSSNAKTPIICLHGWGFHGSIWQHLAPILAQDRDVYAVDLPGYGRSSLNEAGRSLKGVAALLGQHFPFPAIYLGWSLGGLCVQQMALDFPDQVKALVLVASSPCFVQKPDWAAAMPESVFQDFASQMTQNLSRTLNRFLSLQVLGSAGAANLTRQLKQNLAQYQANPEALKIGLDWLQYSDFRAQTTQIHRPTYLCLGEKDRIVPVELASAWQAYWQSPTHLEIVRLKHAAHVPFLSHPDLFLQQLKPFLYHVD